MTTSRRQDPSADTDLELGQVRTSADIAKWLLQQSRAHEAEAAAAVAPDEVRGLRIAASTLEAYGSVLCDFPANTALIAKLSSLAGEYRHSDRDLVEPLPEHYRLACRHLASTLGDLESHLRKVTCPQRPGGGFVRKSPLVGRVPGM